MYSRKTVKTVSRLFAIAALGASLMACGNNGDTAEREAVLSLTSYYNDVPLPQSWAVNDISAKPGGELHVEILIKSDNDAQQIRTRSHMTRFGIAKLGCPESTEALRAAIGNAQRVWVRLISENEELTASVCPSLKI